LVAISRQPQNSQTQVWPTCEVCSTTTTIFK
jgi:hypothetical protein